MFSFKQNTRKNGTLKKRSIIAIIATLGILATLFVGVAVFTNAAYITDGENTQFVFTNGEDAMQILADNGYTIGEEDKVLVNKMLSNILNIKVLRSVPVYIEERLQTTAYKTTAVTIGEFLGENGITLDELDTYDFNLEDRITSGMTLKIYFAPKISIQADGKTTDLTVRAGTSVGDIVSSAGITLSGEDFIMPNKNNTVYTDGLIKVVRVSYKETKTTEAIPYTSSTVNSAAYVSGTRVVTTQGVNGAKEIVKRAKLHDGVVVSEQVISENIISNPVNEVITIGTASGRATVAQSAAALGYIPSPTSFYPGQIVSPAPAGVQLDANGIPVNYVKVMSGKTSAYTSPVGGVVSCGQTAKIGLVAVNPNIIPYGTRMYIIANDGTVYGYAIAADTGGALMNGKVLIDLYMGPNNEAVCYQWGIRTANIYILG